MKLHVFQVSFGNVHATVGYLDYRGVPGSESTTMTVIVVTVVCALVVVIAIVIVLLVIYKRAVNKVLKYQTSELQMTNDIIEGKILILFIMFTILGNVV